MLFGPCEVWVVYSMVDHFGRVPCVKKREGPLLDAEIGIERLSR